jgi:hypothetical protein
MTTTLHELVTPISPHNIKNRSKVCQPNIISMRWETQLEIKDTYDWYNSRSEVCKWQDTLPERSTLAGTQQGQWKQWQVNFYNWTTTGPQQPVLKQAVPFHHSPTSWLHHTPAKRWTEELDMSRKSLIGCRQRNGPSVLSSIPNNSQQLILSCNSQWSNLLLEQIIM